jgi:hypothetical protein
MGEDNGVRKPWLTKDTLVPIGALVGFALFTWWAGSKYSDLILMMQANTATVSEKFADQRLEMQALRFTIESQSDRIGRIEKSVETLTHGAGK